MTRTPTLEEIFAVISAASVGDTSARVAMPDDPSLGEPATKLAIGLNLLLDDLAFRSAERERAMEDLRRSEGSFRLLFADNPHPMWVYDLATLQFLEVNDAAVAHYGYARDEFLTMRITDIRPAEDVPRLIEDLAQPRPPLQSSGEWRHERKDGEVIDVQIASHRFTLDNRDVVLVVADDITDRKRMNQALREREQRLSSIYNTVADVIFDLAVEPDGGYRFVSVNPAFSTVTGVTYDQVVGKRVDEIIPEPSLTLVLERYQEAIREREIVRWEETSDYPNGRLTGEVSVAPVFDAAGTCTHLVGAVHDITERKRTELEREAMLAREQEARGEVERLNAELERRVADRTAQLEAANQELEAFSYSVAHDLRAPLRAIDGFSRLVVEQQRTTLSPENQRYLQLVRDNAQQMGRLIDDLLALSRLSRQTLRKTSVQPHSVIEEVLKDLEPDLAGRSIDLRFSGLPPCEADPGLLKQLYMNLLSNAVKFTRHVKVARIEIGSFPQDGETVYFIKDNGVGFDTQYADKLFRVFQRLHRAEDYEGTGIGLAIVQRIAHRHGGHVWARGEPGNGATFYFTLGGNGPNGGSSSRDSAG